MNRENFISELVGAGESLLGLFFGAVILICCLIVCIFYLASSDEPKELFTLEAIICQGVECDRYYVDYNLTQADCDTVYTDSYLDMVIAPLLTEGKELESLECK